MAADVEEKTDAEPSVGEIKPGEGQDMRSGNQVSFMQKICVHLPRCGMLHQSRFMNDPLRTTKAL